MNWKDQYQQASFRNVNFYCSTSNAKYGRRTVTHEFPGYDKPYSEDLGRSVREFTIDGYCLGSNYMADRDAIIRVCEEPGAGQLIHPYYGKMLVVCKSLSVGESKSETRICRLTFKFQEVGELIFPTVTDDHNTAIDTAKNAALLQIQDEFLNNYKTDKVPNSTLQNVQATFNDALNVIESNKKYVSKLADYKYQLLTIKSNVTQIIYSPQSLVESIINLLTYGTYREGTQEILADSTNAKLQYEELKKLFTFSPAIVLNDKDLSIHIANLIKQCAIICACGLTAIMEYDSTNEAESIRNLLNTTIQNVVFSQNIDNYMYDKFMDLLVKINNDISQRSLTLARLVDYTPIKDAPVCNIAFLLYGSLDQYEDIITRNNIKHPAFVNDTIKVLLYAE